MIQRNNKMRKASGPIKGLTDHIIRKLESPEHGARERFDRAKAMGRFSGKIIFDSKTYRIRTPYVRFDTKAIHIPHCYLEHLWAFMYGAFATIESLQTRLKLDPTNFSLDPKTEFDRRALELLRWSVSLVERVTEWPDLPRADRQSAPIENDFAKKTSTIFVDAVAFVVLHEFAHLTQHHEGYAVDIDPNNTELLASRLDLEREADLIGVNFLHTAGPLESMTFVQILPIMLVMGSAVFLAGTPTGLVQHRHPDVDVRLLNVLQLISDESPEHTDYAQLLCTVLLSIFLHQHDVPMPSGPFLDSKELLEAMVEAVHTSKQ